MGQAAEREQRVKIGDVVEGRYRILKSLGAGGMGSVFLAEHTLIKRRVAIKILHEDLATDADVIERFMNEARAAGTLGHPNIVESTDMGFTQNNVPYIVFEYLEGSLLTDEIYRVNGMPVRRAVRIAEQIASALHAAHNAGIVHRDLKTDNIYLTDKDDALDLVKVLDFGISRFLEHEDDLSKNGMVMGTPESMAPEQITSPDQVDRRADIYALGIMMYEMLAARRPFAGEDQRALLDRIVFEQPPALNVADVPAELAELIVVQMLAKDPGARPQTMTDVLAALEQFGEPSDRAIPRRRTQPIDVSRMSDPAMAKAASRNTPWPVEAVSTIAVGKAMAPPSRGKMRALYGIAAGGLLLGAIGMAFSVMHGGSDKAVAANAPAPAPAASAQVAAAKKVSVTFTADVDGAHVEFRRQKTASPSTIEIAPSDVVEVVEVSAPGYKTERYWLTVDRPTHLTAHLEKGEGTAEASEEETLVALGEHTAAPQMAAAVDPMPAAPLAAAPVAEPIAQMTAPAALAPTASAVAMTATAPTATVDAPVQHREARAAVTMPRKIGRAAAAAQPAPAHEEHMAAAAPAPAVAAPELTPAPAVAPAPAPVVAAAPAPEAPVAAAMPSIVPALVEAKPAPVAVPAVAAVAAPQAIDKATVSSVIGSHRPEVLKCVAAGKKADKEMKGTLTLQLQVDAAGHVRAQVQSTLGSPLVASCVVKAASSWKFPARGGDDFANVSYPFTIN